MASSGVDRRALSALIQTLKAAASSGGLYDRLKAALAAEALTQVQLGFHGGRDPYGEPWPPPLLRNGRPLRDTGRLANSFTTELIPEGFRIGTNVLYARVHQYGATITPKKGKFLRFRDRRGRKRRFVFAKKVTIPARRMVPESGTLGPIWTRAFERTAKRVIRNWRRS
jgi:phage gpG-like protein